MNLKQQVAQHALRAAGENKMADAIAWQPGERLIFIRKADQPCDPYKCKKHLRPFGPPSRDIVTGLGFESQRVKCEKHGAIYG